MSEVPAEDKARKEAEGWVRTAAEFEGGAIPLAEFNPGSEDPQDKDDMKQLCVDLKVSNVYARKRLNILIRSLRGASGTSKKRKLAGGDMTEFYSPLQTRMPQVYEKEPVEDFFAPEGWLGAAARTVLQQADLRETNNPRVSPIALVRCSRGGKTRSMVELAGEVRRQDPSYGIVFISFNTDTPLGDKKTNNPTGELCVRIAFAAYKQRKQPGDEEGFVEFYKAYNVDNEWVESWLGNSKCILFVDELNMLEECIGSDTVAFLKRNFLLREGRGLVFSSHVAQLSQDLSVFMDSRSDRKVVTIPLPTLTSLQETRRHFGMPNLGVQDALYYGMLPGLIVEKKNRREPRDRRVEAVSQFVGSIESSQDIWKLLKTLISGSPEGVYRSIQELMTADLNADGKLILRWVPFHMHYVVEQIATNATHVDQHMRRSLGAVADMFKQFMGPKWQSGEAWEALFLIVLMVRCLTQELDEDIVPFLSQTGDNLRVDYGYPYTGYRGEFFLEKNPLKFIEGIPLESWAQDGGTAISVYYPGHARFEAYDIIVAFWDSTGNRHLYGYQLKEGSEVPKGFAYNTIFDQSYLIRGKAPGKSGSVRLWWSVDEETLDGFFGVSATQWSAKRWRELSQESA